MKADGPLQATPRNVKRRVLTGIVVIALLFLFASGMLMVGGPWFNRTYASDGARVVISANTEGEFISTIREFARNAGLNFVDNKLSDEINIRLDRDENVSIRIIEGPNNEYSLFIYSQVPDGEWKSLWSALVDAIELELGPKVHIAAMNSKELRPE